MGSYSRILQYSCLLADDKEFINKIKQFEYIDSNYFYDYTSENNQRRKLKDLIKDLSQLFENFFIAHNFNNDPFISNFYNVFLRPINEIRNVNEATEIFLAAILIIYRKDIKILNALKEFKNAPSASLSLERKELYISTISLMVVYMNKIEYSLTNKKSDKSNNIDFVSERELYWLDISRFNYYDGGFSDKKISDDEISIEYYIRFKDIAEYNHILNSWLYEIMHDRLYEILKETHNSNKPFWDGIVMGFFYTLYKIFDLPDKEFADEYLVLINKLEEIKYIAERLPVDKKILLLRNNEKQICKLYNEAKEIQSHLASDEINLFRGLLKRSRSAQSIKINIE